MLEMKVKRTMDENENEMDWIGPRAGSSGKSGVISETEVFLPLNAG